MAPLAQGIAVCAAVAAAVFASFPTTVIYPPVIGSGWLADLVRLLRVVDSPRNCLPSLHAAITVLCVAAWLPVLRGWHAAGVVLWGCLICWSAIALRQHLSTDISAGALLGWMVHAGLAKRRGV